MLVVTEPTRTSLKTAGVVKKLAAELGIEDVKILGNKIRRPEEENLIRENFSPEEIVGILPFEEKVWEDSMAGSPVGFAEENLLSGVEKVFQKIGEKRG
jgi:CO dehydrogenase maturation factor